MRWWIKAAAQKAFSAVPGHRTLNFWVQRKLTRSLQLSDFFLEDRLAHAQRHLQAWKASFPDQFPQRSLEIGTGWYPVVPLALRLCGLPQITTLDAWPQLKPAMVQELAQELLLWWEDGRLIQQLPGLLASQRSWLEDLAEKPTSAARLAELGIIYVVADARKIPQEAGVFDLIFSNNTLEHIPAKSLAAIFPELARVLQDSGLMSHYTDHADHYSYGDSRLSPYHFLRYSESQWAWIENRIQSQNRLRVQQIRALYEAAGLEVFGEELEYADSEPPDDLPLALPFRTFSWKDTGVTYSHLVGRKKA